MVLKTKAAERAFGLRLDKSDGFVRELQQLFGSCSSALCIRCVHKSELENMQSARLLTFILWFVSVACMLRAIVCLAASVVFYFFFLTFHASIYGRVERSLCVCAASDINRNFSVCRWYMGLRPWNVGSFRLFDYYKIRMVAALRFYDFTPLTSSLWKCARARERKREG